MMSSDSKKKMKVYQLVGKTVIATVIASGVFAVSNTELPKLFGAQFGMQYASAALVDAEILSNVGTTNNSGTSATAGYNPVNNQNVTFTVSGAGLAQATVVNVNKKVVVLAIPDDLVGKVTPNGNAVVNTAVTIRLNQVPALQAVVTGTTNLLTQVTQLLDGVTSTIGLETNTQAVVDQLNLLQTLIQTGQATFNAPLKVSADGKYLYADLNDGLGQVLSQNLSTILNNLKAAVNALTVTGTSVVTKPVADGLNLTLLPVKATLSGVIDTANATVGVAGSLVSTLADAAVLGDTSITVPTTITAPNNSISGQPGTVTAENFYGSVVNTDLIDVNLLPTSSGVTPVYFKVNATGATLATPVVNPVTGNTTTGYTVTGTTEPGATVTIKDANGTTVGTATADGTGNFSTTLPGTVGANAPLTATATDGAGNVSPATSFITPGNMSVPVNDQSGDNNTLVATDLGLKADKTTPKEVTPKSTLGKNSALPKTGTQVVKSNNVWLASLGVLALSGFASMLIFLKKHF
ncbi:adhesive domain-containing protein [uncultured Leuconostoc sp.]|uniref:adhesive domain-containing protein n=1 Tax=uncultured Leuconostoc sp. TaxID=173262 RepID=UPI0025871088|nr:adhesive domain-containing protein [uncultured Leuconostoc sp.]